MGFQTAFDQANCFYWCAIECGKKYIHSKEVDYSVIPYCVNLAFSCELYVKALLLFYEIKNEKTHCLVELFNILPEDIRKAIINSTHLSNSSSFESELETASKVFVEWRYAHENATVSCNPSFLLNFAEALRDEGCRRFYHNLDWKSYCKIVGFDFD